MALDAQLLSLLVCPETRAPLKLADEATIARINQKIDEANCQNRAGKKVERALEGGLIRADGQWLYPIWDDIPDLIIEDAISLTA
jgi:uncharacterized protein YbaR (Trm112 family)